MPVRTAHRRPELLARNLVRSIDDLDECAGAAMAPDRDLPLTLAEVKATDLLRHHESMSMSDFAARLGISLPAATHYADRLVAKATRASAGCTMVGSPCCRAYAAASCSRCGGRTSTRTASGSPCAKQ